MAVDNTTNDADSTSVSVAVRIRPQSSKEKLAMCQICTSVASNSPQIFLGKDSSFTFDHVFNLNSSQEQIFQLLAKPLIDGCINGFNATILAYGQTGSGKTYTMGTGFDSGEATLDAGIIPRAVQYLFSRISLCRSQAAAKHEPVPEFKVVAQFLELYNEELVDLLDSDRSRKSHLRLHENAQGDIYLTGVSTRLVSNLDDTLKCLRDGSMVRSTASTNMNAQSSRSHAIFTLHIRQQRLVKDLEDSSGTRTDEQPQSDNDPDSTVVDPVPEYETLTAKFHFVDLAGSERLKRTGATGDRAKEGISINRGLLALGNVISALGDKTKRGCHVPYRDSKLTRLLQDSLGGNSRTIMIACVSPSDCDFLETLNTLKYANRARNIRNRVVMNQDKTSKQLTMLRAQLASLQLELDEYRQGKRQPTALGLEGVNDLTRENAFWLAENEKLRVRIKALTATVENLKARNARLLADQEFNSWTSSRTNGNDEPSSIDDGSYLRELVEKYTLENEELRTKLAEAEALAEFGQRPFTFCSPCHPSRTPDGGASNRVAMTNNEFPDLDTSIVTAAEAGLSATAEFFLDNEPEFTGDSTKSHRRRRHRKKHRKKVDETTRSEISEESEDLEVIVLNGEGYVDSEEGNRNGDDVYDASELQDGDAMDDTLLADPNGASDSTKVEHTSGSWDHTLSDASDVNSSISEESDDDSASNCPEFKETKAMQKRVSANEAKLHRSLAHVSSEIDSKQRLVAELQSKAAQLDQLRRHYEMKFGQLQTRIRETERERDSVLANLGQVEHTGEERLRRTREAFEKKLTSLQDEVKQLQQTRQAQAKMEREQAKRNNELRQLRNELEELRRYKVELTKRLQQEAKRARQLEQISAKRVLQLKKADDHIRNLEAAHSAKERALKQKQAEVEALKRKTQEQQRQLSSSICRMTQSTIATTGSNYAPPTRTIRSRYGGVMLAGSRLTANAKTKWNLINKQLEVDIQRRQTSSRLEHDLQTWIKERDALSRRLQRLQRRRARLEEAISDDREQDDTTSVLASFDEQIRNVTAQLDSAQEAIRDCQGSIIELDKAVGKTVRVGPRSKLTTATAPNSLALFSTCTLTEARYILDQLYEFAIARSLQINRLEQVEAKLRADLSVWGQEREQEREVLRLAMQHAGLPLETVDNVLSVTAPTERAEKAYSVCPHHGLSNVAGCDLCSQLGLPSSAPVSSEDSSDDDDDDDDDDETKNGQTGPHMPRSMIRSMCATMDSSLTRKPIVTRTLSESEDVTERPRSHGDSSTRPVKARLRMLVPQDMLGVSSSQQISGGTTASNTNNPSDLMPPPPAGACLLRRPRTLGTTTTQPSAVRRRPTGASSVPQTPTMPTVQSVPSCMSSSVNIPATPSTVPSAVDAKPPTNVSGPSVAGEDVFNRLTSGMSTSPHPSRGSIQPLQKPVVGSPPGTSSSVPQTPTKSYRIAQSMGNTNSFTISSTANASAPAPPPLSAFFATAPSNNQTAANTTVTIAPTSTSFRVPMECTHVACGHSNAVLDVDVLGSLMLTGSKDRTAKLWDLETMEEVDTLGDHPNNVCKVRMCPITGLIFTVCSYFIKVWDRRDPRKCIRTLLSSGLSQDGELEMKVTRRQNICPPGETNIMDIALGGPHPSLSHCMFLATANSVKLWDLRRYYSVGKLHGNHQAPVMVLAAGQSSSDQATDFPVLTVVTGSKDHYIKVFNVRPSDSGLLTPTFDLEPPHYDGIESLALHENMLFSGSRDAAIKKWNLSMDGRQEVMLPQAHKDWIQGLAVTTDGLNLISGCRGGNLKVWNTEYLACIGEVLNAHDGSINAVRVCGDRIFTAGNDKDVRFWRLLDHVRQ